jgi:hypothetical protein
MPNTLHPPVPSPLERNVLGERVFCDDLIGLEWAVCTSPPEARQAARANQRNESVLRALAMLEEHDETRTDDGERAELQRLEGKLDLVLELLAELVRERRPGAAPLPVRFSAEGLCWRTEAPLPPGTLLVTEWLMQPAWPVALRMQVRVIGQEPVADGFLTGARLEGLSDSVGDWLDKLVFRRHRRTVAQSRSARSAEDPPAGR